MIERLRNEFAVKDLGPLQFFLGVNVKCTNAGFFLSQSQYVEELLPRAGMVTCKPVSTPVDTKAKLSGSNGAKLADPSYYRSLAGGLQYLTITRSDITYAVQQACLHMHDPCNSHLAFVKQILRHV